MPIADLPSALDHMDEIAGRLGGLKPYVFLDYDGTLTPIVDDPREATIPPRSRAAVERLRGLCPVAVVSGRDLKDVKGFVGVEGIHYAGSHGFDLQDPDGERHQRGREYMPALENAAERLQPVLDGLSGGYLERKAFALAIHYRLLEDPGDEAAVEAAVDRVLAESPRLRKTTGKQLLELRPDLDWDKGRALLWILDTFDEEEGREEGEVEGETEGEVEGGEEVIRSPVVPMYLGDDLTDEDAFRVLGSRGIGVVIRGEDDRRPTYADYALPDPRSVQLFLERMADRLEG